jgi:glyoxylase-like metal-dependent hydrolase (beta-lactamase superfamily II)
MKIADRIHLVGSGISSGMGFDLTDMGFDLTDAYDCHVFLLDGGDELAIVDTGAGMGAESIVANVKAAGFDPSSIRQIILTHAHVDHAGGVAKMRGLLGSPSVLASAVCADWIRTGNEERVSIDVAKKAGFYPAEYVLEPCPVDAELADGDTIHVGDLALTVLDTPGHCDGHLSLLLERGGEQTLFSADAVFHGGNILLQNIWDCRLDATIRTLRRLRELEVTALIPSHLGYSLSNGQRHIERANDALDRMLIPNQLVSAW